MACNIESWHKIGDIVRSDVGGKKYIVCSDRNAVLFTKPLNDFYNVYK